MEEEWLVNKKEMAKDKTGWAKLQACMVVTDAMNTWDDSPAIPMPMMMKGKVHAVADDHNDDESKAGAHGVHIAVANEETKPMTMAAKWKDGSKGEGVKKEALHVPRGTVSFKSHIVICD